MKYNQTILDFLKKNGVNSLHVPSVVNRELRSPENETILSCYLYSLYNPPKKEVISVADVYGTFALSSTENLVDMLGDYFDRNGDGYHSRSVGILDYNSNEVVEILNDSFINDVIHMKEIDGKYFVGINGNHRTFVLLFHYLNSVNKHPEEESFFREKYQMHVQVESLNLELSGMLFFLKMKYGKRFRMLSFKVEEPLNFQIDDKIFNMSISEFKNFFHFEISIKTCGFYQFCELFIVACLNAKQDPHFKKAIEKIFPELSNLNLEHIYNILLKVRGKEQLFRALDFDNLSLSACFELIKETLLKVHIEEVEDSIKLRRQLIQQIKKIDEEKERLKEAYQNSFDQEEEELFWKRILNDDQEARSLGTPCYELEQIENPLREKIENLKQKRFVFRKKKKLQELENELAMILRQLEQIPFQYYKGKWFTYREFSELVKTAKKVEFTDFPKLRIELDQRISTLENQRRKYGYVNDGMVNISSLKKFCDDCGINFEQVCIEIGFIESARIKIPEVNVFRS